MAPKNQAQPTSYALRRRAREIKSWLCIGLDPDLRTLPPGVPPTPQGILNFCCTVVNATADLAVAFKINFAFFEALGPEGWSVLERVRSAIPRTIPVIADAKRGDIGNTARAYATAILDVLDFDAVTISPYLGWDSVEPFLASNGKLAIVLCKTSNPGATALQDLQIGREPLYIHVARGALALSGAGEVGLVVGATQPEAITAVRAMNPQTILLLPGVGAQGAGARETVTRAANNCGENALVSVSRQILFASREPDYAQAARGAAERFARETWLGERSNGDC